MKLVLAATLVLVAGIVGGWLVRRRQVRDVSPSWLNETAYDKRGDR